ncbi:hypothetical protein Hypma_007638 [Hypsizygus marmoreus]|uniref:Uncharacterized protein n=1 Tax=Hypsizygus marmoreus TaxID=39966 RepID=A0A369JZ36_HYPMA|nr:hypothetical protein Hypma_007638 [Hypsizygus marmoreus]
MAEAQVPLSFPAILRNPGLSDRYAYLHTKPQQQTVPAAIKKLKREHNDGKRWIRRKDNARFTGNPHIVAATKRDYALQTPKTRPTFPEPLPPYLSRNNKVPSSIVPTLDPNSANAGRFSLSLKGMRRGLRKCGFRAELLVRDVEVEIVQWLQAGGTVLEPDALQADDLGALGKPVGETGTVFEVSRTPLQLVWFTEDDSFARYVVHCCARYHEIVSFSKELSGRRLTYLLRPNVTRPDHHAPNALDTPPVTDIDYSSQPDTESDHGGLETDSDVEQQPLHDANYLPAISEDRSPSVPAASLPSFDDEAWSMVGDTDIEGEESGSDVDLVAELDTLSIASTDAEAESDVEATPRVDLYLRQQASLRRRVWSQGRSPSSPSRSPARRSFRRGPLRCEQPRAVAPSALGPRHQQQSFYDYLFL